jgi:DNA-directed RNA polymerase subunit N (RpoN/RPB10)
MLYIVCPTCGTLLGNKIIKYEEEKEKICSNSIISKIEKENLLSSLILNLKLRRYCCNMRFMTYKDIVHDILPIPTQQN